MKRFLLASGMVLSVALIVGCGGTKEIKPDASMTPKVDQADIQKQIMEGMKKGGGRQSEFKPAGEAPAK